ncbi:hypothetical protein L9F63_021266, partial [Diploptera punctata]
KKSMAVDAETRLERALKSLEDIAEAGSYMKKEIKEVIQQASNRSNWCSLTSSGGILEAVQTDYECSVDTGRNKTSDQGRENNIQSGNDSTQKETHKNRAALEIEREPTAIINDKEPLTEDEDAWRERNGQHYKRAARIATQLEKTGIEPQYVTCKELTTLGTNKAFKGILKQGSRNNDDDNMGSKGSLYREAGAFLNRTSDRQHII